MDSNVAVVNFVMSIKTALKTRITNEIKSEHIRPSCVE